MTATIEITGLERVFRGKGGDVKAVDGVDIQVDEGEIYAFLGPNGAGKTTVVRMLVTLLRPTGGSARVAGFDVVKHPGDVRRVIGVALQEAALDPLMTGTELLLLQGVLHGMSKRDTAKRSTELLERVDLTEAADRRLSTYSGGMRRRLDLALALINRPRVLFLDEPTSGLDPPSRVTLWEEVRRLNDEGTTVFLTTQYLEEADQLADRVGIIARGKIVAEGTPSQLKSEVGPPRLDVCISDANGATLAEPVLRQFGDLIAPTNNITFAVRLRSEDAQIAQVAMALERAGVHLDAIDVVRPSLDDVFLWKTGAHLDEDDLPHRTVA